MKLRIGNKELIKDINRSLVINEIRMNGPISRTDISKNLNLGLSTVTNIVEELENQNLVHEVGEADSTGGRKPILLEFNYNYGYIIGIKIEENNLIFALTNLKSEIIEKRVVPFKKGTNSNTVLNMVVENIEKLITKIPYNKNLMGIGVAVSGLVDQQKGKLIYSGMLNWSNVEIGNILENKFNVPVYIDNDVNAYTLAELWYGHGRELNNFIVVTYGSGIGSGIVINKKLYTGDFGGAGEIGHMVLVAEGRKCECGQRGCLEAYASEDFIVDYIRDNIKMYSESKIDLTEDLSIEKVYEYAKEGDMLAIDVLRLSAKYLGYGLLSVINLLNPSTIILAGEGMIAKDIILPVINDIVKNNFFKMHEKKVQIKVSELGDEGWVIGASTLAISKLFEIPLYEGQDNALTVF
ncbi:ROK family protein (putative glucokinase) [Thermoanaerobacter thermohydrosulfuricus]|uniref:ROK family protein n=3 Tax=Thermoanaerobacter TaxID=1754 RepID=B0KBZ3_THEP3|nr:MULTISPECIES: ROK family transcriptional regulator [Thermoanaerobacter]ABY93929.1 ROK family protein [Thermoanaerobacter pseudethanolicus ATCC 33223]ADV78890.1 ROK family protein [Thermoanaerobacter brockii subsp. finnii Ako-1]SDF54794.1 ROK family protein (putative glucokinase) [Thermoanaerobacter thermohydrosulfuricus]SFE28016.1 ROK family protein (putative glucokinase) [Thermoanaerobacter thermohydrosulfuricus]HBW60448.1 ROK family transcriptional regulator [Thermoanaerobacter sp.]